MYDILLRSTVPKAFFFHQLKAGVRELDRERTRLCRITRHTNSLQRKGYVTNEFGRAVSIHCNSESIRRTMQKLFSQIEIRELIRKILLYFSRRVVKKSSRYVMHTSRKDERYSNIDQTT